MAYILSSQNVRIEQDSASIGARLGAFIVDSFFVGVVFYLLFLMKIEKWSDNEEMWIWATIIYFAPLFYPLLCEVFMSGQTVGKRLFHIRVVTLEGGGPKLTALILRWMLLPFDICFAMGIGELCIFFTKHQQRLGDLAAGTWVVKTQTYDTEQINLSDYIVPKGHKVLYPKAKNLTAKQAALIAEVLQYEDSSSMSVAILDLCRKVEKVVGPSIAKENATFLQIVLSDYRFEKQVESA